MIYFQFRIFWNRIGNFERSATETEEDLGIKIEEGSTTLLVEAEDLSPKSEHTANTITSTTTRMTTMNNCRQIKQFNDYHCGEAEETPVYVNVHYTDRDSLSSADLRKLRAQATEVMDTKLRYNC